MEAELVEGKGGVFEVEVDERLVFSKKQEKRFPEPGEVERELEAHLDRV